MGKTSCYYLTDPSLLSHPPFFSWLSRRPRSGSRSMAAVSSSPPITGGSATPVRLKRWVFEDLIASDPSDPLLLQPLFIVSHLRTCAAHCTDPSVGLESGSRGNSHPKWWDLEKFALICTIAVRNFFSRITKSNTAICNMRCVARCGQYVANTAICNIVLCG